MGDTNLDGLTFRRVNLRELGAVQDLYSAWCKGHDNPTARLAENETLVSWQMKRVRQQLMMDDLYHCIVAVEGETIVGYVSATVVENGPVFEISAWGEITELVVTEPWRERNVEATLVEMALDTLRQVGVSQVSVELPISGKAQQELLGSQGFEPVATVMHLDMSR